MALTDVEIQWINYVSGQNIDPAAQAAAEKKQADKEAFLATQMAGPMADLTAGLDDAMDLTIVNPDDRNRAQKVWDAVRRRNPTPNEIPWRATDDDVAKSGLGKWAMRMDVEVDTVADVSVDTADIPPEKIEKLMQVHQKLTNMQHHMEQQLDDNGERLFSDEDIRKELWTPLMREGLIPENMIPDKFSEQAIAFNGAMDLYGDKIKAFSATHSKKVEKFKQITRITKEVVTVTGSIVSNSITISNATAVADKNNEIKGLKKEDADLKTELNGDPAPDQARIEQIEARQAEIKTETNSLTKQVTEMKNETTYAQNATAILIGGISGTELVVDHATSKEKDPLVKWCNTIEGALNIAQTVAGKTVDTAMRGEGASSGMITCVSTAITASFSGVKMVPTLILAVKEPNDDKRAALINKLMGNLAATVASSINSVAGKLNAEAAKETDSAAKADLQNQEAALKQIASALKLSIVNVGKGPAVLRAIKNGNKAELAMLLGGAAISAAFGGSSEAIYDAVREDDDSRDIMDMNKGEALFHEATGDSQERGQDSGSAATMDAINAAMSGMTAPALSGLKATSTDPLAGTSAEELQTQIEEEAEKNAQEQAEEELKEAFSPAAMKIMMEEADQELVGFEELYSNAYPDSELTKRTPEEIVQAQAAIDRAMANTNALRQKVALINGLTSGGAGLLAALVPGTAAVVAAQKVAKDIYVLKKCVDTHNAWVDSMEVAFAAQSGVAAAVQNTLKNAKIHLDHAKVSLVLHSAQAGAAVAQVMDPSGVSSIVSASLSMAESVVEFGYKMHTENEIRRGWNAYKDAKANPGNRKAARAALRMNSTLAKCCIAYGASIMGDPSAQQAMRASGLTVAALQNDKDICVKLISYLENELNEDPTVLKVVNEKDGNWHPGKPALTLASWTAFKAAAARNASPLLAPESLKTPAIDRLLAELADKPGWQNAKDIDKMCRDFATTKESDPSATLPFEFGTTKLAVESAIPLLDKAQAAFEAYRPLPAETSAIQHEGMKQIAATCATLCKLASATAAANSDTLGDYIELHS